MYGRRGKVRIICECMEGEERYESAGNDGSRRKVRISKEMYMRVEKMFEWAANVLYAGCE